MTTLIHFGQNKVLTNDDTYTHFKVLYIIFCNGHDIKESQVVPFSFYVIFMSFVQLGLLKQGEKQLRITMKAFWWQQYGLSSNVNINTFFFLIKIETSWHL